MLRHRIHCNPGAAFHQALLSFAVAVTLLSTAGSAAQEGEVKFRTSWRTVASDGIIRARDNQIELRLEDAVAAALQNNLGLQIQRLQRAQSLFSIQQNNGIYDLGLTVNGFSTEENTPAASQLDGALVQERAVDNLSFRLDQLVNSGGTASIDWRNQRLESNSQFAQVNPSYTVDLDVVFSQPLLRDFGRLPTERNLRVARISAEDTLESLEMVVAETIERVSLNYWTLVGARAQLEVARESLALAEELHEMNQIQVEVGTKAPLELIQSEVGIATRQEDIIRASAAVEDAADLLRQLLNLDGDSLWAAEIVPSTPAETQRIDIDDDEAFRTALDERPEIQRQKLNVERLALDSRFFGNQVRPRLDLQVRYGYNGLGGDVLVPAPGSSIFDEEPEFIAFPGGYSDAARQVLNGDFEGWQVAVNLAYPLQNRAAKAQKTTADLALEQGQTQLDESVLGLKTEVRRTARAVRTAAQQIDSASKSTELAERNLDAERKRYENGLSTSFQVLEIQEDLSQAASRLVSAITGYRRALATYQRSIGRLLEQHGVVLEDETDLDQLKPE